VILAGGGWPPPRGLGRDTPVGALSSKIQDRETAMQKERGLLLLAALAALLPATGVGAEDVAVKPAARVVALSADDVPAVPYDAGSYRLLVPSSATGGEYAVIELVEGPGYRTPWHRHDAMEERYYVVEGTLTLSSAEGTRDYPAGSYAVIPPGAVHAQGNTADQPVKLLLTLTPGGFEEFFADRAELATTVKRGDPQFPQKMGELAGRHGRWLQPADAPPGGDALRAD
jgi:quercetin dioxygenase-like cupin family protein